MRVKHRVVKLSRSDVELDPFGWKDKADAVHRVSLPGVCCVHLLPFRRKEVVMLVVAHLDDVAELVTVTRKHVSYCSSHFSWARHTLTRCEFCDEKGNITVLCLRERVLAVQKQQRENIFP